MSVLSLKKSPNSGSAILNTPGYQQFIESRKSRVVAARRIWNRGEAEGNRMGRDRRGDCSNRLAPCLPRGQAFFYRERVEDEATLGNPLRNGFSRTGCATVGKIASLRSVRSTSKRARWCAFHRAQGEISFHSLRVEHCDTTEKNEMPKQVGLDDLMATNTDKDSKSCR